MKKLFCGFIMSFVIMFFIWTMIAWITVPDFVENVKYYHIDLYAMFDRFNVDGLSGNSFIKIFRDFINSMEKINTSSPLYQILQNQFFNNKEVSSSFKIIISLLNSLMLPLNSIYNVIIVIGYLIVLLIQFLGVTTFLAEGIFAFIFNPIFVKVVI